VTIMKTH